MTRRFLLSIFVLFMSVTLILTGCGAQKEPKEALKNAAAAALNMDSYVSKSHIKITDLTLDASAFAGVGEIYSMLKDSDITLTQVYQKEPMQTQASLEVKLKGDFSGTITFQYVMTQDKIYVKVPKIPFLPIPDKVVGKFVAVDLNELKNTGLGNFNAELLDTDKTQRFVAELADVILTEYDSETYLKDIPTKEIELPEGIEAKQVVQFYIDNDNLREALTTLVNHVLPQALDIVAKDEYRKLLQFTPKEIEKAKKELAELDQEEFQKDLDDVQKDLIIHKFYVNTAIDKNDYPAYQEAVADIEFKDPDTGEEVKLVMEVKTEFTSINEKPEFSVGIPQNTITVQEFVQEMTELGY